MLIDPTSGRWTSQGPQPAVAALRILAAGSFQPVAGAGTDPDPTEGQLAGVLDLLCQKDLSVVGVDAGQTGDDPAPTARAVAAGQFDVASLAGGAGRLDPAGLAGTIASLRSEEIEVVGAGPQPTQARRPLVVEVTGMRVGLMSMGPGSPAPGDGPARNALDPARSVLQIRDLHGRCDLVVVLVHRAPVALMLPSPQTVRLYRSFVEAGADAVIGLGGPAPGPIELYESRPIAYNLPAVWPSQTQADAQTPTETMLVRLEFRAGRLALLQVIPLAVDSTGRRLEILQDAARQSFLARLNEMCQLLGDPARHARLWDAWCLRQLDRAGQQLVQAIQAASQGDPAAADQGLQRLRTGPRIEAIRRGLERVADGAGADEDAQADLDAWIVSPTLISTQR